MSINIPIPRVTFADYLTYYDGSDTKFELVNGKIIPIAIGTGQHGEILNRIYKVFDAEIDKLSCPWIVMQKQIGVRCSCGIEIDTVRIPDVVVMLRDDWLSLQEHEAVIGFELSPPLLVVEVVSASTKDTDYRSKRNEYATLGIPEYWTVDPLSSQISVFVLSDGLYDVTEFSNSDRIISPTFPRLQLTPQAIFSI